MQVVMALHTVRSFIIIKLPRLLEKDCEFVAHCPLHDFAFRVVLLQD